MALLPKEEFDKSTSRRIPTVLDEETYTENLERIITRDFFPDYGRLRDQKEYLEAEEKKDFEKMRQIALKYSRNQSGAKSSTEPKSSSALPFPSPATFETPVPDTERPGSVKPKRNLDKQSTEPGNRNLGYEKRELNEEDEGEVKSSDAGDSLNNFLSKYTSEDNESFETILEKTKQAQREKYSWMYEAEIAHAEKTRKMLMLEFDNNPEQKQLAIEDGKNKEGTETEEKISTESTGDDDTAAEAEEETTEKKAVQQVIVDDGYSRTVDTWTYKAKNHLMYIPDGLPSEDPVFKKPYDITHGNTRFQKDPFKDALDRTKLVEAAAENAKFTVGERVGHDGKAILPQASPSVNGYGFVATPSPAPGVDMSPVMTWGVIEGTPARLDGSGTPTPGPSFKFPKESRRDQLTYKMVDENTKKNRAKKQAALKQVKESMLAGTPRRVGSIMSSERISTLSPAARRLVNKKLGIGSDKRLKESYTPTPRSTRSRGDLTPISKTPKLGSTTRRTPGTSFSSPSITDNLLNIPTKKKKASDFF